MDCLTLPEEIVEHILKFANGSTLETAKAVCRKWRSIVRRLEKYCDIWRLCCGNEISKDELFDILSNMYPRFYLPNNEQDINWRLVYKQWKQWSSLLKWTYLCRYIHIKLRYLDEINCLNCSGDWLFIGTSSGLVLYNIQNSFQTKSNFAKNVLEMELFFTDVDECYEDTYRPNTTPNSMTPGFKHDILLFHDKVCGEYPYVTFVLDLHTEHLKLYELSYNGIVHKNKCMYLIPCHSCMVNHECNNNIVLIRRDMGKYRLFTRPQPVFPICFHLDIKFENANLINYYDDMICFVEHPNINRSHFILSFMALDGEYCESNKYTLIESNKNIREQIILGSYYILYNWHCKVTVVVSQDCMEIFIDKLRQKFYPCKDLSVLVTAVHFYLNMLFLGTDLGKVFVFCVEKPRDLLLIDLKKPSLTLNVCKDRIKGFKIMETHPRPTIVCYTRNDLFIVDFIVNCVNV